MGIGVSLILSAVGAVLIWAVNTTSSGFNIHVAGVILLVVIFVMPSGAAGFARLAAAQLARARQSWNTRSERSPERRST